MHWLVAFSAEDRNVSPNTLRGQMKEKEQIVQMKEKELESPIKWKAPSFEAQDPLIEVKFGN